MSKLLTNKYFWFGVIIALFIGAINYFYQENKRIKNQLSLSTANVKAYVAQLDSTKNVNRVFQFTVDQLNYYNDSILQKMNAVRKELKIKDGKIAAMQYQLSQVGKIDTIRIKDTIFSNPSLSIDTTITKDLWYTLDLKLRYPNEIIVAPTFTNENYVNIQHVRETIEPPKKFFLWRWFQKKQTILEVKIVEKNPYSKTKESRFIEIIK